ncbi:M24 family metallopeptidase [Synechococcus elongatus IITB5]
MQDHVEANGFSIVEDYTGHGVGRNLHEEPSVFNYRTRSLPNVKLRAGMTWRSSRFSMRAQANPHPA